MVSRTYAAQAGGRVEDLGDRGPRTRRGDAKPSAKPAADAAAPADSGKVPRSRASGTAYDVSLKHPDPTSLDKQYIVRTGTQADDEPGRTSRLRWQEGRQSPITECEAYAVYFRRQAAKLARLYADPVKNAAALKDMPPTLAEAVDAIPERLPAWDETTVSFKIQLPERLMALFNAYLDILKANPSQVAGKLIYDFCMADVQNPKAFAAQFEQMRDATYRADREQRREALADEDEDEDEDD
jgi:hypothetical protein